MTGLACIVLDFFNWFKENSAPQSNGLTACEATVAVKYIVCHMETDSTGAPKIRAESRKLFTNSFTDCTLRDDKGQVTGHSIPTTHKHTKVEHPCGDTRYTYINGDDRWLSLETDGEGYSRRAKNIETKLNKYIYNPFIRSELYKELIEMMKKDGGEDEQIEAAFAANKRAHEADAKNEIRKKYNYPKTRSNR